MPSVRQIVRDAAKDDYRFSSLVKGIVESDAFLNEKVPAPAPDKATKEASIAVDPERRCGMYVTKKHLHRRTVLRGMGISMALPLLDAMIPAAHGARQDRRRPEAAYDVRLLPVMAPIMDHWTPDKVGKDFDLKTILEPLAPYKNMLTVVSGTENKHAAGPVTPSRPAPGLAPSRRGRATIPMAA